MICTFKEILKKKKKKDTSAGITKNHSIFKGNLSGSLGVGCLARGEGGNS